MVLKKIKFYSFLSLGIISSITSFKVMKEEQTKQMKTVSVVIKENNFFENYNKTYSNKNIVYYNENESYEEVKSPILVRIKLKENEKLYYYSKKMSK